MPRLLKVSVTRRQAEPVDAAEGAVQLQHYQAVDRPNHVGSATVTAQEAATGPEPEQTVGQARSECATVYFPGIDLNRQVVCYLMNSIKLNGRLKPFDQSCLLTGSPGRSQLTNL